MEKAGRATKFANLSGTCPIVFRQLAVPRARISRKWWTMVIIKARAYRGYRGNEIWTFIGLWFDALTLFLFNFILSETRPRANKFLSAFIIYISFYIYYYCYLLFPQQLLLNWSLFELPFQETHGLALLSLSTFVIRSIYQASVIRQTNVIPFYTDFFNNDKLG